MKNNIQIKKIITILKYIVIIIFNLATLNIYAVQNDYFCINVNETVRIEISFHHFYNTEPDFIDSPDGLYWSLLTWAKNTQNSRLNTDECFYIFIDRIENTISLKNNNWKKSPFNAKENYFFYNDFIELNSKIISLLNTFYNVNKSHNNLSSIEVFAIKGRTNGEVYSYDGKVFKDYIFFSEKEAKKIILSTDSTECFIEKILLTKENISNYVW